MSKKRISFNTNFRKEVVVMKTWIGRTLVMCQATFAGGKCKNIEIKEYNGKQD